MVSAADQLVYLIPPLLLLLPSLPFLQEDVILPQVHVRLPRLPTLPHDDRCVA